MSVTKSKPFDVIFYIYYNDLNVLNPYLNAIRIFRNHGYNVAVYSLHNEKRNGRICTSIREDIVHYFVAFPFFLRLLCKFILCLGAIPRIVALRGRGGSYAGVLKKVYFVVYCYFKVDKGKSNVLVAEDPICLWAASLVSQSGKSVYVYFGKELFLSYDITSALDNFIKRIERKANKNALVTVEFDETRAELLRLDNKLAPESMIVVPNAPIGKANLEKETYFRDKFEIEKEKKVLLYTGGISDYDLTYEMIGSIETWPKNVVLVMHCWGDEEEIEKIKSFSCRFKREIYFSTNMLPFDEIYKLYGSADIGFAMYGGQDLNHKYAGLSSGKLFNFMKECVPIITNDTPSCKKAIEATRCGVCIKDIAEIGDAIREILANEKDFRVNCQKAFSNFSFDRNFVKLIAGIESYFQE